jgi:hypothetical protein
MRGEGLPPEDSVLRKPGALFAAITSVRPIRSRSRLASCRASRTPSPARTSAMQAAADPEHPGAARHDRRACDAAGAIAIAIAIAVAVAIAIAIAITIAIAPNIARVLDDTRGGALRPTDLQPIRAAATSSGSKRKPAPRFARAPPGRVALVDSFRPTA